MKKIGILLLYIAACYISIAQVKENGNLSFLHTAGQDIINESGRKIFLKGVGLGNWLLPAPQN